MHLQLALNLLAWTHQVVGELSAAAMMIDEERLIAETTGNPPVAYNEMMLAAWRGREPEASQLIEAILQEAAGGGLGAISATYANAVLHNGLGRHDAARDAARRAFESYPMAYGTFLMPAVAEGASRTGEWRTLTAGDAASIATGDRACVPSRRRSRPGSHRTRSALDFEPYSGGSGDVPSSTARRSRNSSRGISPRA